MSAEERSGWRDERISRRHREYGENVPAVDLDFLLLEYDNAEPAALIEHKLHHARVDIASPSLRAITSLGTNWMRPLPVLLAKYWPDTWAYRITPLNDAARIPFTSDWEVNSDGSIDLTEREYVKLLYYLRSRIAPDGLLRRLETQRPPKLASELLR